MIRFDRYRAGKRCVTSLTHTHTRLAASRPPRWSVIHLDDHPRGTPFGPISHPPFTGSAMGVYPYAKPENNNDDDVFRPPKHNNEGKQATHVGDGRLSVNFISSIPFATMEGRNNSA